MGPTPHWDRQFCNTRGMIPTPWDKWGQEHEWKSSCRQVELYGPEKSLPHSDHFHTKNIEYYHEKQTFKKSFVSYMKKFQYFLVFSHFAYVSVVNLRILYNRVVKGYKGILRFTTETYPKREKTRKYWKFSIYETKLFFESFCFMIIFNIFLVEVVRVR